MIDSTAKRDFYHTVRAANTGGTPVRDGRDHRVHGEIIKKNSVLSVFSVVSFFSGLMIPIHWGTKEKN